jgi:hypothetical protein
LLCAETRSGPTLRIDFAFEHHGSPLLVTTAWIAKILSRCSIKDFALAKYSTRAAYFLRPPNRGNLVTTKS